MYFSLSLLFNLGYLRIFKFIVDFFISLIEEVYSKNYEKKVILNSTTNTFPIDASPLSINEVEMIRITNCILNGNEIIVHLYSSFSIPLFAKLIENANSYTVGTYGIEGLFFSVNFLSDNEEASFEFEMILS